MRRGRSVFTLLSSVALFLATFSSAVPYASGTEEKPFIGVIELSPGNVSTSHANFKDLTIKVSHPESSRSLIGSHATAVASRLFPDNGGSEMPLDGGWASRDAWGLWSYQAVGTDAFRRAFQDMGPVAPVMNHSVGFSTSTSAETTRARIVDEGVFQYRTFFTQVAHNQGPDPQTLLDPAGAYNAVVLGATGPNEAEPDPEFHRGIALGSYLAFYSSQGTTTDGRYKPDLVAPGTFLHLATYDADEPNDQDAQLWSGTSFAAPYTAGVAAYLIEHGSALGLSTDPLILKSILQTTAQEVRYQLPGAGQSLVDLDWNGWTPANTDRPLDPWQGAGEISTPRALELYTSHQEQDSGGIVEPMGWDFATDLQPEQTAWYFFQKPVRSMATLTATLDWFREAAGPNSLLPLDDLDLELWRTDGVEPLEPVTLSNSALDNVEHIHRFGIPETGYYALAVRFKQDRSNNGENTYGLSWTLPESPYLPGDVNLDGDVDLDDFERLKLGFGVGSRPAEGDIDFDRDVDLADFSLLKENFGAKSATFAVAEPSTCLLAWMALFAAVPRRLVRRRRG